MPRGKKALLSDSKLSDADRRKIRLLERNLYTELRNKENDLSKISSTSFQEKSKELDELYECVHYPREANLDATNLDHMSNMMGKQAELLSASDLAKFDISAFGRAAQAAYANGGDKFEWAKLGKGVSGCFQSVPQTSFLFGSMDTQVAEKKKKAARKAKSTEEVKETEPDKCTDYQAGRSDAQTRRLAVLQNKLKENTVGHEKEAIDIFNLVVNPDSFTQTVENLFDVSFLVRNGEVEFKKEDDHSYSITGMEVNAMAGTNEKKSSQCIIGFTPKEIREIAELWNIEKSMIDNRVE